MQVKDNIDNRSAFFFPHESVPRLAMIDGQDNQLVTER